MSEIVAEGIAEARVLQSLIDVFSPIVDEARIHFNDDGIGMRAVDPANIAMHDVDLSSSAFESYESPGSVVIGVNLERFDEVLDPAGAGDLVNIAIDMESRKLVVDIDHIHQEMALIDPDAIRSEPDLPDLDLPNAAALEGGEFTTALDVADVTGDHIDIIGDAEANALVVHTQGDTDETEITFDGDRALTLDVVEETKTILSSEYLQALTKPIPDDAEVRLRFGGEFPLRLSWVAIEGYLTVETMQAPRVQTR